MDKPAIPVVEYKVKTSTPFAYFMRSAANGNSDEMSKGEYLLVESHLHKRETSEKESKNGNSQRPASYIGQGGDGKRN